MAKVGTSTFEGIAFGPTDINGGLVIGSTNDILYGGDVSGDAAGLGIPVSFALDHKHFALAVYADDAGTISAVNGWVSAIFGSHVVYAVHTATNWSAFGVAGQTHIGASVATSGNIAGVYGIVEVDSTATLAGNCFGGLFGATIPSTVTGSDSYWMGGVMVGGTNAGGTTTNNFVGMYFQNPGAEVAYDGVFGFDSAQVLTGTPTNQTTYIKVRARGAGGSISTKYIHMYDTA